MTAVGGTSLALGAHGRYLWETGWGTLSAPLSADGKNWSGLPGTFRGGAGGGRSTLFAQPSYQSGIVPSSLSQPAGTAAPNRVIPDIAADADPGTGMLTGLTTPLTPGGTPQYAEEISGGTSLAAPLLAAIQADAQQAAHGIPIGFANPALYARYGTPDYRDVTDQPGAATEAVQASRDPATGTISYQAIAFGHDSSLHATSGYDDVTGVGTPTARYLDSYGTQQPASSAHLRQGPRGPAG